MEENATIVHLSLHTFAILFVLDVGVVYQVWVCAWYACFNFTILLQSFWKKCFLFWVTSHAWTHFGQTKVHLSLSWSSRTRRYLPHYVSGNSVVIIPQSCHLVLLLCMDGKECCTFSRSSRQTRGPQSGPMTASSILRPTEEQHAVVLRPC